MVTIRLSIPTVKPKSAGTFDKYAAMSKMMLRAPFICSLCPFLQKKWLQYGFIRDRMQCLLAHRSFFLWGKIR